MASRERGPQTSIDDSGLQTLLVVGAVGLAILAGVVGWGIGRTTAPKEETTAAPAAGQAGAEEQAIASAPAFTADDLTAEPRENWITNGGTLMNQRYSPLDEIDTGNVQDLKGVWRTQLRD